MRRFVWAPALLLAFCVALMLAQVTRAEPGAPQAGGTFTVNGTGDNSTSNCCLTLREAILLAKGGTGPGGLNRSLSAGEQSQVGGACVVNGSGNITSGCGAGITDAIVFDVGLGLNATITLTSSLPAIADSAATIINGVNVLPLIDASSIGSGAALTVSSNGNSISDLTILNSPASNFDISGDGNTLNSVGSWSAGTNGIHIAGNDNVVKNAQVGLSILSLARCDGNKGNGTNGVQVVSGAHRNTVMDSYVACNGSNGVVILGPAVSAVLGVSVFTPDNKVLDSSVFQNGRNGVEISGGGSTNNVIQGTSIYSNTLDGINERNGASANVWTQLNTYANGGLGIDVNGDSDVTNIVDAPYPVINSVSESGGFVTVQGTASSSGPGVSVTVEVYSIDADPSGFGEGRGYRGQTMTNASGAWTITFARSPGNCYTAFQTRYGLTATSSEFGPNSCHTLFLPLIAR